MVERSRSQEETIWTPFPKPMSGWDPLWHQIKHYRKCSFQMWWLSI
jgi:hypothetical protein